MAKKKEKLELELLVICEYATVSRDNKLTIAGITDQAFISKVPAQYSKLFVVGIVEGKVNSIHRLTLQAKGPNGEEVFPEKKLTVRISPKGKTHLIARIANFPLASLGLYEFKLKHNNKTLGEKELNVMAPKLQNIPKPSSKYTN